MRKLGVYFLYINLTISYETPPSRVPTFCISIIQYPAYLVPTQAPIFLYITIQLFSEASLVHINIQLSRAPIFCTSTYNIRGADFFAHQHTIIQSADFLYINTQLSRALTFCTSTYNIRTPVFLYINIQYQGAYFCTST